MKSYLVIRYGNDASDDGADGEDTNFLVRARNRDEAAMMVDAILLNDLPHNKVQAFCHQVIELGLDNSGLSDAAVIFGPWYSHAHINHYGYKVWERETSSLNDWMEVLTEK